jgi:hypothetical protein
MTKSLLPTIILCFSCGASALAQTIKKPELFAGYSFEDVDTGIKSSDLSTTATLDDRFKLNGFNLSAATYFSKHFGITGDFSAHFDNRNDVIGVATTQSKFSLYNLTGGPQFRFSNETRLTPFAHALAGVARSNLTETVPTGTSFEDHNTSFAMNFGGGVDYRLNDRFCVARVSVRLQPDLSAQSHD